MYELSVIGTAVMMLISAVVYVYQTATHKAHPVPATWVLMLVVLGLSFWMYWTSPRKSWTGNIAVTSGLVNIIIILAGVIATNVRDRTLSVAFDKVQKYCLLAGGVVVVFWAITREPLIAYILVQVIALIAYLATVKRLWRAEKSTEPVFIWVAVLIACLCAIYPAWIKNDTFAWIYLGRAVPSTSFVVVLILRIKHRNRA